MKDDEEGAHGGGMNVFAMALSGMDQTEIGWMMVAVIFSQLVLDEALRRVEASVGTNARACLREVYKELSTSFETKVNEATLQAFEYSHIFVFSFAIVYVIQSAVIIASIVPIQRRLIRLHAYGDAVIAAVAAALPQPSTPIYGGGGDNSLLARLRALLCCVCGGPSGAAPTLGGSKEAVRAFDGFRAFRQKFMSKHSLPASFLFDHYLIEVYDRWVISKLDIPSWCWALMCQIFGIHALVARFSHFAAFCLNRWSFLCFGWLLLLADYALFLLVHRVHTRVLKRIRSSDRNSLLDLNLSTTSPSCRTARGNTRTSPAASVAAAGGGAGSVGQRVEEDALKELRRRREELHAQSFREQQQQQQGAREELGATIGGTGTNHADAGVLRHPPRHWHWHGGLANLLATTSNNNNNAVADSALGFKPWESFVFNYGTEALNIVRCLYLAAWLCTYSVPAFWEWFSVGWALLYVLVIPIPAIITAVALIPRMVTRFLLVSSLSVLDLEAFDAVVEYMEDAEAALKDIAHLLQCLTNVTDTEASSVEQLFASLTQRYRHRLFPSNFTQATNARVARALSQATPLQSSIFITYSQFRDFLRHHGVHLALRRFRALVRFIDLDLCGHVDLEDFRALLRADHLFATHGSHPRPSAARVARLLSQHSQYYQQQNSMQGQDAVLADVRRLFRSGSSVLMGGDRAAGVVAAAGV